MMAGEILTDRELRQQLIYYGLNPGPIVPSTRKLYEKKLMEILTTNKQPVKPSNIINSIPGVEPVHGGGQQLNGSSGVYNGNSGMNGHNSEQHEYFNGNSNLQQQQNAVAARSGAVNGESSSSHHQKYHDAAATINGSHHDDVSATDVNFSPPLSGFLPPFEPAQQPLLLGRSKEYGATTSSTQPSSVVADSTQASQMSLMSQQQQQQQHQQSQYFEPQQQQQQLPRANKHAVTFLMQPGAAAASSSSTITPTITPLKQDYDFQPSPFGRRPIMTKRTLHDTFGNSFNLVEGREFDTSLAHRAGRRPQADNNAVANQHRHSFDADSIDDQQKVQHKSARGPLFNLFLACLALLAIGALFYVYRTGMYTVVTDQFKSIQHVKISADDDPIVKLRQRSPEVAQVHGGDANVPGA